MLAIKNWVGKVCVCALLAGFVLTGCAPSGPRALRAGIKLLDNGRYPEAVEELNLAASLLKTNAQAWNYLGLAYHLSGDLTDAARAYEQALKLDRNLAEAHFNLGCLWLEQSRPDAARPEFSAYTLQRGNSIEGWLKLGTAQFRSRDLAGAEKSFRETLRLSPQQPEALNGLGLIEMQRNRPREAAQDFSAALKQQPDYAPALLNLAIVSHYFLNNRPLALQKYREYLAGSPRPANWDAVNAAANALEQEINSANRPAAQIASTPPVTNTPAKTSNTAAPRAPTIPKPEPVANSAKTPSTSAPVSTTEVVKVNQQPEPRVAQDLSASDASSSENSPEQTPQKPARRNFFQKINPLNLFRRGARDNKTSDTNAAPAQASASESNPVSAGRSSGRIKIIRYKYHAVPKLVPGDREKAEKLLADGLAEHKANHFPEAMKAYHEAAQADPSYFVAYYNLAIVGAATGDISTALSAGETALAIRPDSADARYNFAQALKLGGYYLDSANELAMVLARNPNDARAHLALGNLYAQQFHEPAKAREHYLKVLESDPRNPQAAAIRDWLVSNPR